MFPVATMCRVLDVSTSGYYAWRTRKPSKRALEDRELLEKIRHFHKKSKGTYGAPRIHRDLIEDGISVSRKRVARLMREAGLEGASAGGRRFARPYPAKALRLLPIWSRETSPPMLPTVCGSATSPTFGPVSDSCTWQSFSMPSAVASWDGPCPRL